MFTSSLSPSARADVTAGDAVQMFTSSLAATGEATGAFTSSLAPSVDASADAGDAVEMFTSSL
jgi:hypothetical protein